jgi:hypothetical protein
MDMGGGAQWERAINMTYDFFLQYPSSRIRGNTILLVKEQ